MIDDEGDDNTPREYIATNSERLERERLEDRVEEMRLDISSLLASRRTWRWTMTLGAPALLGAIVVVMLWAIDRVSTTSERAGETRAKIDAAETLNKARNDALENLIRLLQQDISQLRQRAGLDTKPSGALPSVQDKVTSTAKDPHVLVSNP